MITAARPAAPPVSVRHTAQTVPLPRPVSPAGTGHVVPLAGRFDAHVAPALAGTVGRLGVTAGDTVAIDLERVRFVDAAGLEALEAVAWGCAERRAGFRLQNPSPAAQAIPELAGSAARLPVLPDREEAAG